MTRIREEEEEVLFKVIEIGTSFAVDKQWHGCDVMLLTMRTGNYSVTWHNMKLVLWPLMGGLLHLVQ